MPHQAPHAVLPLPNHDEGARQDFTVSLRRTVNRFASDSELAFKHRAAPAFLRSNSRLPRDRHDVRKVMEQDPYGQLSGALRVTYQELLWDSVVDSVERQLPKLMENSRKVTSGRTKGSLRLDAAVKVPRYLNAVDIHMMPGNYDSERLVDDISAGAIYDRGVYLRVMGSRGIYGEGFGTDVGAFLKKEMPTFRPKRILDQGCSVGGSTFGLVRSFPQAEIHAIDVAAPMLRYAHARAESLGAAVHFSQQNAEKTDFADGSFDFIFSFALLHETSTTACRNILREAHRLLAPGGLVLYLDLPEWNTVGTFQAGNMDWDTLNNAEPFIGKLGDLNREKLMTEAGFARDQVIHTHPAGMPFPLFGARKS